MCECSDGEVEEEGFEIEDVSKCIYGDAPVKTFRPTFEEFQDFLGYIRHVEFHGAHKTGICKIIPPKEWVPQTDYDQFLDYVIKEPIEQHPEGGAGILRQQNIIQNSITVREYRELCFQFGYETPEHTRDVEGFEELERLYWKKIHNTPHPLYGADNDGSVSDPNQPLWNFQKLPSLLDHITKQNVRVVGVNTPYLYYGMWRATFAWHTEDMDLYSINYIHYGEPKTWYVIPPEQGHRFEVLAKTYYGPSERRCGNFLRHKMTIISPSFLKKRGITVSKTTQRAGEIIVTFPYAYHQGFNHGFNCAEATNFATERWIEFGKWANHCTCQEDAVKIDMDVFVQLYQPERYFDWRKGRDVNKIDFNALHYPKLQMSPLHLSISNAVADNDPSLRVRNYKKRRKSVNGILSKPEPLTKENSLDSSHLSSCDLFFEDETEGEEQSDSTDVASESEQSVFVVDQSQSLAESSEAASLVSSHCRYDIPLFTKLETGQLQLDRSGSDLGSELDNQPSQGDSRKNSVVTDQEAAANMVKVIHDVSTNSSTTSLEKLFDSVSREKLKMVLYKEERKKRKEENLFAAFASSSNESSLVNTGTGTHNSLNCSPVKATLQDDTVTVPNHDHCHRHRLLTNGDLNQQQQQPPLFPQHNVLGVVTSQQSIGEEELSSIVTSSPIKQCHSLKDADWDVSASEEFEEPNTLHCSELLDSSRASTESFVKQQEPGDASDCWDGVPTKPACVKKMDHSQTLRKGDNQYRPSLPLDFSFNLSQAHILPKCAVCSIYRDFYGEQANKLTGKHEKIKTKYQGDGFDASKPLMSCDLLYTNPGSSSVEDNLKLQTMQRLVNASAQHRTYNDMFSYLLEMRKPCPLLSCLRCKLSVHATCYQVSIEQFSATGWLCDPCALIRPYERENPQLDDLLRFTSPICAVCPHRGGAYKMISQYPPGLKQNFHSDQQIKLSDSETNEAALIFNSILQNVFSVDWIHVVCALSLPEVKLYLIDDVTDHFVENDVMNDDDIMCSNSSEDSASQKSGLSSSALEKSGHKSTSNKSIHIDMSCFTTNRRSLVCSICHKQSQRAYLPVDKFVLETEEASEFYETSKRHLYSNFSAPVQCSHEMCSTAAHLTCAFLSQQWVICPSGARLKAPPKCTTHGLAGGGGGGVPVSDRPQLWCKYHWLVPISNRVTSRFGSSSGCNEKQRNRSVVVHSNSSNSSSLSPSSKRSFLSQDSGCRLSESSFNATSPYSTTSLDCCSDSSSDFNLEPYSRVRAKVPNFKKRLRGTYLGRSKIVEFYKVLFDDGSCSDNLLAEDFFGYNWSERGNPHLNERVDILWADGQLYPGKFTGVIATPFYEIEIDQINATKWVELKDLVLDSPQNVDS